MNILKVMDKLNDEVWRPDRNIGSEGVQIYTMAVQTAISSLLAGMGMVLLI